MQATTREPAAQAIYFQIVGEASEEVRFMIAENGDPAIWTIQTGEGPQQGQVITTDDHDVFKLIIDGSVDPGDSWSAPLGAHTGILIVHDEVCYEAIMGNTNSGDITEG